MKWLQIVLLLAGMELVHFLAFSAGLWWLGRHWYSHEGQITGFALWIWMGILEFWNSGPGTWFISTCAALLAFVLLEQLVQWIGLARKRAGLEAELEQRSQTLAEELRTTITEEIRQEYQGQQDYLDWYRNDLQAAIEKQRWHEEELKEREQKVEAWREELQALRKKDQQRREAVLQIRRRADWALQALASNPPKLEEAQRHCKKILKNQ